MSLSGANGDDLNIEIPKKPPNKSASEHRRATKPIMEKRRRARINHCLNELKALILDALNKDPSRHSKLEKADILEMTVRHLQNLQRQQMAAAISTDPSVLNKFRAGFNECATEVSRYINRIDGVDMSMKQRLVGHLSGCVTSLHSATAAATSNPFAAAAAAAAAAGIAFPGMIPPQGGNGNGTATVSGPNGSLQVQIPLPAYALAAGLFHPNATPSGAVNLTTCNDINNNTSGHHSSSGGERGGPMQMGPHPPPQMALDPKMSNTPPASATSTFTFTFPPHSSPSTPTTPTTPSSTRGLSINISPHPYPGPSSMSSSGTFSSRFRFSSTSSWNRGREGIGSISPGSSSSLGSLSPTGSDSNDIDMEPDLRPGDKPAAGGDVWRPW